MSSFVYTTAKEYIALGLLSLLSVNLKAVPVTASYTPDAVGDEFLSDVPSGARTTTPATLTGKQLSRTNGALMMLADPVQWAAHPETDPIVGLVLFEDTGTASTSKLLAYVDYFSNLPLTPDGVQDVKFTFPTFGVLIIADGGLGAPGQTGPAGANGNSVASINGLRLSPSASTPVPIGDVSSTSTIYLTPYLSGEISLWDATESAWVVHATDEISLALTGLTTDKNYDVFAYWDSGTETVKLELGTAWAGNTTPNTLDRQNGVLVKDDTPTRRHIGVIRTTGTTTTCLTAAKRFIWNRYNQVQTKMSVVDTTNSWAYTTATWRASNGNSANAFEYVTGDTHYLSAHANSAADCSGSIAVFGAGVGIDSTTVNSAIIFTGVTRASGGSISCSHADYRGRIAAGYHKITWLEIGTSGATFYGDANSANFQAGMIGEIWM